MRDNKVHIKYFFLCLILLFCGCTQWFHPDNINMAQNGMPAVELDADYMRCQDFKGHSAHQQTDEKVVILFSSGGTGHKSAADAIARALHASEQKLLGKGRSFTIAQVDVLYDLLPREKMFDDYFKSEKWDKLKNLVSLQGLAEKIVNMRQSLWDNKIYNRIMHACDPRPPSVIISVFPVANYVYAAIAKKNNIPFAIIPTDFEISHFIRNIDESSAKSSGVFLGLPLEEPEVTSLLYRPKETKPIIPYCIIGSPVRPEFTALRAKMNAAQGDTKEITHYRKSVLKISDHTKSILVTLGGKGGALELITQYVQALHDMQKEAPLENSLHVIVASAGDETIIEGFKHKKSDFADNSRFKTTVVGRLDAAHMALAMASVDAVLMKPGGSTVSEAITLGAPMIIKSDSTLALPWEKTNMLLAKRMGWAVELNLTDKNKIDVNDLIVKVKQVLSSPTRRHQTPFINFQTEFPKFYQMLKRSNIDGDVHCIK